MLHKNFSDCLNYLAVATRIAWLAIASWPGACNITVHCVIMCNMYIFAVTQVQYMLSGQLHETLN